MRLLTLLPSQAAFGTGTNKTIREGARAAYLIRGLGGQLTWDANADKYALSFDLSGDKLAAILLRDDDRVAAEIASAVLSLDADALRIAWQLVNPIAAEEFGRSKRAGPLQ